jgi:hypothetical protein
MEHLENRRLCQSGLSKHQRSRPCERSGTSRYNISTRKDNGQGPELRIRRKRMRARLSTPPVLCQEICSAGAV